VVGIEPLAGVAVQATGVAGGLAKLLVVPGPVGPFFVGYPMLSWLGIMLMGWGAADLARRAPQLFRGRLLVAAAIGLVVFVVVRGLNGWEIWDCSAMTDRWCSVSHLQVSAGDQLRLAGDGAELAVARGVHDLEAAAGGGRGAQAAGAERAVLLRAPCASVVGDRGDRPSREGRAGDDVPRRGGGDRGAGAGLQRLPVQGRAPQGLAQYV
jgi:hypothetical protein